MTGIIRNKTKLIDLLIIKIALIAGLAIPTYLNAATWYEWNFESNDQIRGWRGEGIETAGSYQGFFRILGNEQFRLISPSNLRIPEKENPYLRIRFMFRSPRYLQVYWQPQSGKPVLVPEIIQPVFDRNFHTYWIPLKNKSEFGDKIDQLGLIFGGRPGWVEIDSIEILPFFFGSYLNDQWREFMLSRQLHPGTINSLNSPSLFNKSFISWLNKLVILITLVGVIFYYRTSPTKRKKILLNIGMAILIIWIIYDIRETFSQFKIIEGIHAAYIKPPPEEKTFPALGDFYRFVDFCREKIPQHAVFFLLPKPYWPFDCRLKYYLYPRYMEFEKNDAFYEEQLPKYYIVYNAPQFSFNQARKQIIDREGNAITKRGNLVARYNRNSFIFLEDKN